VTGLSAPSAPGPDWRPRAGLATLRARAELLAEIRRFFADRDCLEVETPALSAAASTDPALSSFMLAYSGPAAPADGRLFLHTSPELAMKRLLAAGVGDIYQIARVFRDGEAGRWHNPEFTLLEWYRLGLDHWRLMDEVEALVGGLMPGAPPYARVSYSELFERHLAIDPLAAGHNELERIARAHGITPVGGLDAGGWRDLLFSHVIEPALRPAGGVFVYGFPADQAALARLDPADPRVACRFELYLKGVELANGFYELSDAAEQRRRFDEDLAARQAQGLSQVPADRRFLAALASGLPDCSGVALGVDRLLMLMTGARHIEEVLAFPVSNA